MNEASEYILKNVEKMLKLNKDRKVDEFIKLILKGNKIFLYGVGRSGLIAKAFAIRLVQLGLKVFFIGDTTTPIVSPDDVVVIISNTGETMSAIQTANISGRMGAKVIAITSIKHSKLAHAANIVICLHPNDDENRERLAPLGTLFEDATLIFLDGIVSDLMKKMDENERIMRSRHAIWV